MKKLFVLVAAVSCLSLGARSAGRVSPDGKVGVDFAVMDGKPKIAVAYESQNVATVDLGLVLEDP